MHRRVRLGLGLARGRPQGVDSAAFVFRDAAGARRAFDARGELARLTGSLDVEDRERAVLGDEAELLRGRGTNHPASAVVWRDGNVVALLAVEPADDEAARALSIGSGARTPPAAACRPWSSRMS